MTDRVDQIWEEAAAWVVRTGDPSFSGWDDFTLWLEKDPAHAEAYQQLADDAASLDPILAQVDRTAGTAAPTPIRRKASWPMAIAASAGLFGALGLTALPSLRGTTYETAPGKMRTVTLAAGDTLVLNGGTSINVRQFFGRRVRLDHGQLLLRLNGHGTQTSVRSGDLEMVDIGTVFEVARDGRSTTVVVSEGTVLADLASARLEIPAGQRLDVRDGDTRLRTVESRPEAVGSWTQGQLDYVAEPIERVAADLGRSTGIDFSVAPAMRRKPFSGTLSVDAIRRDPASLEALAGVPVRRSGTHWVIG